MSDDLHLTSPLMHGPEVEKVQKKLAALGFDPGPIDGEYGAATTAAVRAFQKAGQIEVDGIVGPETRAALSAKKTASIVRDLAQARTARSTAGQLALAEAIKHLGEKEQPQNSNRTEFGKWFGVDGVPWCNIFVSYCFKEGAKEAIGTGFTAPGVYANGITYVPTTEAWLRGTGQWVGKATPQPGDIAIFNWDGGVPDHIGIVERYLGDGRFTAIEGNTAVGNDSNGGEVMRRERTLKQVDGFGRLGA